MWIKIGETLYNTDNFCTIEQRIIGYGPTRYEITAMCTDGKKVVLSNEPILQRFVGILSPEEVD